MDQKSEQKKKEEKREFKKGLFDNMRKLMNIVDELRDIGLQDYISLPRIAVVGSQSSGKSSLLENVVGLEFLPRGDGLVTRRPLEMRLIHQSRLDQTYAIFPNEIQGEKFFDFNVVRQKIDELTDKVAGTTKNIVNIPIVLQIYSKDCPDLTMIDLPGITRIPLTGSNQPQNIEQITKNMVYSYIKDERTIILCVIPANTDISTSDGLQMAKQIDKDGQRTIGVITKIDIMDKGTDAKKTLLGQEVDLKLGFVAVKNRCQQDIVNKTPIIQALKEEDLFFQKHPVYSTMPGKYLGTKALVSKLTSVLQKHVKRYLPEILKEINLKVKECEDRLKDLGAPLPNEDNEKMHLLWNLITQFCENLKNQVSGSYDNKITQKSADYDLTGGAIIKIMFNELYGELVDKKYKPTACYSNKDIEKAILLYQCESIPGFPSIDSFLYLITPLLEQLKDPALECLYNVFNYIDNLCQKLIQKLFERFPAIIDDIQDAATQVLAQEREKAKIVIENVIEAELGYIFTNNKNYLTTRTSIVPGIEKQFQQKEAFDANKAFLVELRDRIDDYFCIVVQNVRDTIPKIIGYFLVKSSQDIMQYNLYTEVTQRQSILDQLGEPKHLAQERKTITSTLAVLRKAQKLLKNQDFTFDDS